MSQPQRRFTTILATDVVGFSDMMGRDEAGTLRLLKARHEVIEGWIARHQGRVFGGAGDSLIAEFPSPLSAVHCAYEFQKAVALSNRDAPRDQQMWFRAGINMADLMVDGDNLYGEGINIAARLEAAGQPGGVCISEKVYDEVRRNTDLHFVDGGTPQLKNIGQAVRIFHLRVDGSLSPRATAEPAPTTTPLEGQGRKSVVVRPLKVSGDESTGFVAEGLQEGLNNSLGLQSAINVMRDGSAAAAADFVLEGSVRGFGERLRLSFSLTDTGAGCQVWGESYDRHGADVFALEDEISRVVAAIVRVKVKRSQLERLSAMPDDSLSVSDLLDKAAAFLASVPDQNDVVAATLTTVLAKEPDNSMALCMLAYCRYREHEFSPLAIPAAECGEIRRLSAAAVTVKPDNYFGRLVAGLVAQDVDGDFEAALRHAKAALAANPELMPASGLEGIALCHLGDLDGGMAIIKSAIATARDDPHLPRHMREMALAHLMLGDVEGAVGLTRQLVDSDQRMDRNWLVHAAMLAMSGDRPSAIGVIEDLRTRHPTLASASARPTRIGRVEVSAKFDRKLADLGVEVG